MEAGRGQADGHVAGLDLPAINEPFPLHHADDEASQVVFAALVHVGEDRRLAADEGAVALHAGVGDAADDVFEKFGIVVGEGDVIEEEQRLGPGAEAVVDAHRHEVDADGVVDAGHDGDFELRADAVGA